MTMRGLRSSDLLPSLGIPPASFPSGLDSHLNRADLNSGERRGLCPSWDEWSHPEIFILDIIPARFHKGKGPMAGDQGSQRSGLVGVAAGKTLTVLWTQTPYRTMAADLATCGNSRTQGRWVIWKRIHKHQGRHPQKFLALNT